MKYTTKKPEDILASLRTDPDKGLTGQQVNEIQKEKGLNKFEEGKKESAFQKVLRHLKDFT